MKLLVLFTIVVPFVLAATNRECRTACQQEYGVGGRAATVHDKGEYGYNRENDCTCVFPWSECCRNLQQCDRYCDSQHKSDSFCHFASGYCIMYAGIDL
jgi:hypothetical protein